MVASEALTAMTMDEFTLSTDFAKATTTGSADQLPSKRSLRLTVLANLFYLL